MIEITRILCPVDFSSYSRLALNHAVAIAKWYGASVLALHVLPQVETTDALGFVPVAMSQADRDKVTASLNELAAAAAVPGVTITPVVRTGTPVAEILAQADSMQADLLVLGSHGRSGFERLMLGSVTEKLLRKAKCPVLVVPRGHSEHPAVKPRMLCPVDFSDSSLRAVEYALSMAQESDAHLTLLHVVEHEPDQSGGYPEILVALDSGMTVEEFRRQHEEGTRRRLDDLIPAGVSNACTVDTLVMHGKPWREILRIAREQQSDLIVIGVLGRGALDLAIFGSTTQHVIRQAECPVLTLRK